MWQTMENEVELKLTIKPEDAPLVGLHPSVINASANTSITRKINTIYYDTTDLKLFDAGISLRIRCVSGRWIQSIKAVESAVAGLHQRMEWESVVANCQPDFSVISDPALAKLFADQQLCNDLKPIFQTKVQRDEWQLDFGGGDKIELVLDKGQLVVGETREPISE